MKCLHWFFLHYLKLLYVNAIKHAQEGCNQGIGKCKIVAIFLQITKKNKNAFATIPILSRYAKSYYECDSSKDNKSIEFMFHDVKKNQLCCHKKFSFLIYLFLSELLPSYVAFVLPKYTIKIASDVVEQ